MILAALIVVFAVVLIFVLAPIIGIAGFAAGAIVLAVGLTAVLTSLGALRWRF